jgi:hypothetical protein
MKSAIILLIVPIILGIIPTYELNGSSESEINCYEKGFRWRGAPV